MILDALSGEPRWLWSRLPHPAVVMGRLVRWCDDRFNAEPNKRLAGALCLIGLCASAGTFGWGMQLIPGQVVDVLVVAIMLAQKSLVDHVRAVADALRLSLHDGRRALAMIVSRDTQTLDASGAARAALESAAENLSDGVVAPLFWFSIAGLPGLLVYKMTNTADSMIGYLTDKHAEFGWAAARFDDLLNLIPSRMTALIIWIVTTRPNLQAIKQDAPLHRSPNAGWPEAAMAHGLGIALSGPRSYDGQTTTDPYVNAAGTHALTPVHIDQGIAVLWRVWAVCLGLAVILQL